MPDEITVDEWRRLAGGARPRTPPAPRVKAPRAERAEAPDAGDARRQPYCERKWLFAQEGQSLLHFAYHRTQGARVGPAVRLDSLLAMIDAEEAGHA